MDNLYKFLTKKNNTRYKKLLLSVLILLFAVFSCNRNKNIEQQRDYENDSIMEGNIPVSGNEHSEKLDVNNEQKQYDDESDFIVAVLHGDWGEPIGVSVEGYKGSKKIINIPPQINSLPVGHIGKDAFSNKQLTGVTIPDSVWGIEERAFSGNQLASIIIPDSVTYIGNRAFADNQITSVTLSNSIKELGERVFYNNKLTVITIPDIVTDIKSMAFAENQFTAIIVTSRFSLSNNSFPNSFSVFFESNRKKPGTYTWDGTSWSFVLSEYVDPKDFKIYIPKKEYLERGYLNNDYDKTVSIFNYTGDSTEINIPPRIRGLPVVEIAMKTFEATHVRSQITSVTIPDSVRIIGTDAFYACMLTSVAIPDSVTYIGDRAFGGNQLTSVTIGNGVTNIRLATFYGNKLTSVIIPDSVTHIGKGAFRNNQLTDVIIGNNVTAIEAQAFFGNSIESITIPDNVNLIEGTVGLLENVIADEYGLSTTRGSNETYSVFPFSFDDFYNANGKKAGTYRWDGNVWSKKLDGTK
jgi:hypothetical protein